MTRERSLLRDDSGQTPYLLVASIAVFIIVSAGLAAALIVGIQASGNMQVNSALTEAVSTSARLTAMQGYDTVATLDAEEELTFTVGGLTAEATRTIELNPDSRTARITVSAGRFAGSGFLPLDGCEDEQGSCIIASELISGAGLEPQVTP